MTRPTKRAALLSTAADARHKVQLEPPERLTVRPAEAWAMLGISASYGWRLVQRGRLKTIKLGPATTLIEMSELRAFLARNATPDPEQIAAE